ncbi:hypothetical protein [Mucilaginibacter sp. 22184]|uniref:hypothetical protein n=1 Tax=Mucilaginibacter sp. 22184 TaxID=3453887 RepID=UPI003F8648BF
MSFTKADLHGNYSWIHTREDDPKLKGEPDSSLLNRSEGYEVLYMIRKLMAAWGLTTVLAGQKIERMIKAHPAHLRSQEHVMNWIYNNWDRY